VLRAERWRHSVAPVCFVPRDSLRQKRRETHIPPRLTPFASLSPASRRLPNLVLEIHHIFFLAIGQYSDYTTGGRLGFDSRQGWRFFSLRHRYVQLGHTQSPVQWLVWTLFLGVKRPGCEAYHSLASNGVLPPLPYAFSWRGA